MKYSRYGLFAAAYTAVFLMLAGCATHIIEGAGSGTVAFAPEMAHEILMQDEVWEGKVKLRGDLLVPPGRTLRVMPGTRVRVYRTDEAGAQAAGAELLVQGELLVEGTPDSPVIFEPGGSGARGREFSWKGIVFDGGGGRIAHSRISGAENGVTFFSASPLLEQVTIEGVRNGLMFFSGSAPRIAGVDVQAREGGLYSWPGSAPEITATTARAGEREGLLVAPGSAPVIRDSYFEGPFGGVLWGGETAPPLDELRDSTVVAKELSWIMPDLDDPPGELLAFETPPRGTATAVLYSGEQVISSDAKWEGEITVDGTVTVAPRATLTVEAGTVVRFAVRDSDGDGVGESALVVDGRVLAAGDRERPVVFTAAGDKGRGQWGGIYLGEGAIGKSVFRYALVESSRDGIVGSSAGVDIIRSVLRGNNRALRLRSSKASITASTFRDNGDAIEAVDSSVDLVKCRVTGNLQGLRALRSRVSVSYSAISDNIRSGFDLRDTQSWFTASLISGNTPGLQIRGGSIRMEGMRFFKNNHNGFYASDSDPVIKRSFFAYNLGNGLTTGSGASIHMRSSIMMGNLRFALENESDLTQDASTNVWVLQGDSKVRDMIYEKGDDPRRGTVLIDPARMMHPEYFEQFSR